MADAATGLDVLQRLHDEMGAKSSSPDLNRLWRELGLRLGDGGVEVDNHAPLANVRASITDHSAQ